MINLRELKLDRSMVINMGALSPLLSRLEVLKLEEVNVVNIVSHTESLAHLKRLGIRISDIPVDFQDLLALAELDGTVPTLLFQLLLGIGVKVCGLSSSVPQAVETYVLFCVHRAQYEPCEVLGLL